MNVFLQPVCNLIEAPFLGIVLDVNVNKAKPGIISAPVIIGRNSSSETSPPIISARKAPLNRRELPFNLSQNAKTTASTLLTKSSPALLVFPTPKSDCPFI